MKLGKGINYTRYCLWWDGSEALDRTDYMMPDLANPNRDKISATKLQETADHVKLIKKLGFQTIRLAVCFNVWTDSNSTDISQSPYWVVVDNMVSLCDNHGLKLVIDYHHAPLADGTLAQNKERIFTLWRQIADRLKNTDPQKVIFEIFNEPNFNISTNNLVFFNFEAIQNIRITGGNNNIRKIVVGGNGFYEIGFGDTGLLPLLGRNVLQSDPNVIFTVHFYEPRLFTMQGLDDGDTFMPLESVEYPAKQDYTNAISPDNPNAFFANNYLRALDPDIIAITGGFGMGTDEFINARMNQLKALTDAGLTVWCGEIGAYRFFADKVQNSTNPIKKGSLERYLTTLLNALKRANVDWCWWDFEGSMSFFNPVPRLQLARPELGRPEKSPDFAKPFGFASPYTDDKVDALMRKLLGLNERVTFSTRSFKKGQAQVPTLRIKIDFSGDISNVKELIVSVKKKTDSILVTPRTFTLTPNRAIVHDLLNTPALKVTNIRVMHHDGSFFDIS